MIDLSKVVVFGPPKEAALYFERVLPLDFGDPFFLREEGIDLANHIPYEGSSFDRSVVQSLLGEEIPTDVYVRLVDISIIQRIALAFRNQGGRDFYLNNDLPQEVGQLLTQRTGVSIDKIFAEMSGETQNLDEITNIISSRMQDISLEAGFNNCASWSSNEIQLSTTQGEFRFMAALQGLKLVDPAKASWKQVVEFRKDKNSFKSLRELRVFFQTNYTGKDLSFIIDDLGSRIDKYDDARKMWGFETAQRGISVIFDQKNLVTTSVGSLAAHAAGGTLLTAAAAGAILALGPAALEVSKVWLEGRKAELDNQVRYLANLRKKIGE